MNLQNYSIFFKIMYTVYIVRAHNKDETWNFVNEYIKNEPNKII